MDMDPNEPAASGTIRSLNRSLVLDTIRTAGPTSRAGLARSLGLAKPTVSEIVAALVADGVVREGTPTRRTGARSAGRGRPPVLLDLNERHAFVLGIHLGVHDTTVAIADATGAEVARRRIPTPHLPAEESLREVGALAREVVVRAGIPRRRLAAAAISLPGQVDTDAGTCVHAPNLGWRDVPVVGLLGAALGVPIHVHNTVQAAAVAEHAEGSARGARTVALIYAGTGVGAAILHDGVLFHGATGLAGELGHAVMPGLDARCTCGRHGCVETAASADAVARAARDAVRTGAPTRMAALGDGVTSLDVYAAAETGDTLAQALLGEAGRTLGIAASWLVNLVNPDVLVLAGGLVGAGPHVIDPFRAALDGHAATGALARLELRTWSLGQDAKLRGAVLLALQQTQGTVRVTVTGRPR
ncbi:MAG TPA: ROK family transcriptional regulator [Candidatus Limnocylindrales bacterium]|jgi:predicted NBD/HSP70 family sugar kinase